MNIPLSVLYCCLLLGTVVGCTPSSDEVVSVPSLEGNWRHHGTAYRYYDAAHNLISRDSAEGKALGGMVITSTAIHLYRDGGEPMESWPYKRSGDTIQFTNGGGYWTILQLTSHLLVTKAEGPYPFATETDTARDAQIGYDIR